MRIVRFSPMKRRWQQWWWLEVIAARHKHPPFYFCVLDRLHLLYVQEIVIFFVAVEFFSYVGLFILLFF
jgi:hypothetical protein